MVSLHSALSSALFYNHDVASASSVIENVPMPVSYIEPENVTCASCQWSTRQWEYPFEVRAGGNLSSTSAGIRSAPPLGGLGAGSVELRADGTLSQWTIFNQHPAASGKYGAVDDAVLFARVGGRPRVVRTRAPESLRGLAPACASAAMPAPPRAGESPPPRYSAAAPLT